MLDGFDGELLVGELRDKVDFNTTQSAVMSEAGRPQVTFNVFDTVLLEPTATFIDRFMHVSNIIATVGKDSGIPVRLASQEHVLTMTELLALEEAVAAGGYEGLIVRHAMGRYKNNRSTFREQGMIKLKRFIDAEAIVTGFEELLRNKNEAFTDNLGYQKRSASIENQIPGGTLGKLYVKGLEPFEGIDFAIGSGFDMSARDAIWSNRSAFLGKIVRYKYQPVGVKNAPRAPIFLGFRDNIDVGMPQ
jgi:DNA ligase-1